MEKTEELREKEEIYAKEIKELNQIWSKRIQEIYDARINDAERFSTSLSHANEKVHSALLSFSKFVELFEAAKRRPYNGEP